MLLHPEKQNRIQNLMLKSNEQNTLVFLIRIIETFLKQGLMQWENPWGYFQEMLESFPEILKENKNQSGHFVIIHWVICPMKIYWIPTMCQAAYYINS